MGLRFLYVWFFVALSVVYAFPGGHKHVQHEHHLIHAPLYIEPEIVHVHSVETVHEPVHIVKKIWVHDPPHFVHHDPVPVSGGWW